MSFKIARIKAGKKAAEVAEFMHVSPTTVSQWENGTFYPEVERMRDLADYYGCTVNDLLEDEPRRIKKEKEAV